MIDALADCITDPREPSKIRHELKTMLTQRVCGIALGYEDGNDHQTLRNDPMMQMLAEMVPDPDDPVASGTVRCNEFMLQAELDGCALTLFPDGRAIIKGTDDANRARSLYAKYVGA